MIGFDLQCNIQELFDAVFGIKHYEIAKTEQDKGVRQSSYGTPVLTTIIFQGKDYNVIDKDGNIIQENYKDFELPIATLASIRRAKRIVKTQVSTGTVKEMFGYGDWQIDINGICIPDKNQPQGLVSPQEQIDELKRWEKVADAIRIKGGLFIHPDINDIVIEEFNTWQVKGSPNVIPFTIKAVSDQPVELLLI